MFALPLSMNPKAALRRMRAVASAKVVPLNSVVADGSNVTDDAQAAQDLEVELELASWSSSMSASDDVVQLMDAQRMEVNAPKLQRPHWALVALTQQLRAWAQCGRAGWSFSDPSKTSSTIDATYRSPTTGLEFQLRVNACSLILETTSPAQDASSATLLSIARRVLDSDLPSVASQFCVDRHAGSVSRIHVVV